MGGKALQYLEISVKVLIVVSFVNINDKQFLTKIGGYNKF